ncbi:MAG: ATP:cob(I)alamin adenosyltransferase, partial [Leptonema sp. (in: Bacteria)]|nr:ATP:cob(I)alamin adenosyltransferase [Leptonema sp. (in: bacteria)]
MKIYTKKGDTGLTGLATGERVSKHDKRVDLYGTADELNSVIGLSASLLELEKNSSQHQQLLHELQDQQCLLFELGAELAGFFRNPDSSIIEEADISLLEESMDQMTA